MSTTNPASPAKGAGLTFGHYRTLKELGRGATSIVYLGELDNKVVDDKAVLPRYAAIKVVSFKDDGSKLARRFRKLFTAESSIASQFDHPNIAKIYDSFISDEYAYMVMEYVEGQALDSFSTIDKLLPLHEVVSIIFKLAMALDYAHRLGIIHRDIKPANALLSKNGEIKLTDFGLALNMKKNANSDETFITGLGSPAFMSPEQIKGYDLNHQTDLYSLGVMFYQMLAGRVPFRGKNPGELIYKIINTEPIPVTQISPSITPKIDEVIKKALQKDLYSRYRLGSDFAKDLTAVRFQLKEDKYVAPDKQISQWKQARGIPSLSRLDDTDIWELVRMCSSWETADLGDVLRNRSNTGTPFGFIINGRANIEQNHHVVSEIRAGDMFGELSYLDEENKEEEGEIVALERLTYLEINPAAFALSTEELRSEIRQVAMKNLLKRARAAIEKAYGEGSSNQSTAPRKQELAIVPLGEEITPPPAPGTGKPPLSTQSGENKPSTQPVAVLSSNTPSPIPSTTSQQNTPQKDLASEVAEEEFVVPLLPTDDEPSPSKISPVQISKPQQPSPSSPTPPLVAPHLKTEKPIPAIPAQASLPKENPKPVPPSPTSTANAPSARPPSSDKPVPSPQNTSAVPIPAKTPAKEIATKAPIPSQNIAKPVIPNTGNKEKRETPVVGKTNNSPPTSSPSHHQPAPLAPFPFTQKASPNPQAPPPPPPGKPPVPTVPPAKTTPAPPLQTASAEKKQENMPIDGLGDGIATMDMAPHFLHSGMGTTQNVEPSALEPDLDVLGTYNPSHTRDLASKFKSNESDDDRQEEYDMLATALLTPNIDNSGHFNSTYELADSFSNKTLTTASADVTSGMTIPEMSTYPKKGFDPDKTVDLSTLPGDEELPSSESTENMGDMLAPIEEESFSKYPSSEEEDFGKTISLAVGDMLGGGSNGTEEALPEFDFPLIEDIPIQAPVQGNKSTRTP